MTSLCVHGACGSLVPQLLHLPWLPIRVHSWKCHPGDCQKQQGAGGAQKGTVCGWDPVEGTEGTGWGGGGPMVHVLRPGAATVPGETQTHQGCGLGCRKWTGIRTG